MIKTNEISTDSQMQTRSRGSGVNWTHCDKLIVLHNRWQRFGEIQYLKYCTCFNLSIDLTAVRIRMA